MSNEGIPIVFESQNRMKKVLNSPVSLTLEQQAQFIESFRPVAIRIAESQKQIYESLYPSLRTIGEYQLSVAERLQPTIKTLADFSVGLSVQMQPTLSAFSQMAQGLQAPVSELSRVAQEMQIGVSSAVQNLHSPLAQLQDIQLSIAEGIKSSGLLSLYDTLNEMKFNEVFEVFEDLSEPAFESKALETPPKEKLVSELTVRELQELLESKASMVEKDKPSILKDFFREVLMSYGVEVFRWLMLTLYLWLNNEYISDLLDNHEAIIFALQKRAKSLFEVKHYMKEEGLFKYEYVNKIGITRVETVLRKGNSRTAPIKEDGKLQTNTVVSILAMRGNWLQVQVTTESDQFEGWVEKSKVIRFKKEAT